MQAHIAEQSPSKLAVRQPDPSTNEAAVQRIYGQLGNGHNRSVALWMAICEFPYRELLKVAYR
jgi:hypothetical protein